MGVFQTALGLPKSLSPLALTAARASGGTVLTPLPIHSTLVYDGDSNMQGVNGITLMNFLLQFGGGMGVPIVGANKALAGDTTAKCLANLSAVLSTNAAIYVGGVGRNDLYSITTEANRDSKVAAAKANIEAIWDAVLAANQRRVFHFGLVPVSANYGNWSELRQQGWNMLNEWIVQRNGSKGGRVYTVNISGAGWDPATDYYTDNQHLSYSGSFKAGRASAPTFRQIMGDVPAFWQDPSDFGNIIPAGVASLAGTGGAVWGGSAASISGDIASSCVIGLETGGTRNVTVEGLSVVASKEVDARGFNVQRLDLTMTENTPAFTLYFLVAVGAGTYNNATRYYSKMRCQFEDVDNVMRFDAGSWVHTNTTSYNASTAFSGFGYTPVDTAGLGIGHIDEADVALSAGLANTGGSYSRLWAVARIVFMGGEGRGTIRLSRPLTIPFTVAESS